MNKKKKVLFGMKINYVKNAFAELKRVHGKLLEERQQELQLIIEETKALEMEVAELEAPGVAPSPRIEPDDHNNMTVPLTISWLQIQAEEEIQKIHNHFILQKEEYEKEIEQLTQIIENGKNLMDSIVDQFSKAIENFHSLDQLDTSFANVFPLRHPLEERKEAFSAEETYSPYPKVTGSNYWEGIESFISSPLTRLASSQVGNGKSIEGGAADTADTQEELFVTHQADPKPEEQEVKEPEMSDSDEITSAESPGINQELENIKKRYIVGKVAGSDLFDTNGTLIVANQTKITGEIVEQANRAGVLADLIVHMKIPDLSEAFE